MKVRGKIYDDQPVYPKILHDFKNPIKQPNEILVSYCKTKKLLPIHNLQVESQFEAKKKLKVI